MSEKRLRSLIGSRAGCKVNQLQKAQPENARTITQHGQYHSLLHTDKQLSYIFLPSRKVFVVVRRIEILNKGS